MGTKISQLSSAVSARADEVPVNQAGTTKKVTAQTLSALALDPSFVIVFNNNYANFQAAIDAAEALSAADDTTGVVVLVPPDDFSAQNGLIKKNVSIVSLDGGVKARVGTITIRPTSATVGPKNITLKNIKMSTLTVSNETASGSGVFNTANMLRPSGDGVFLENSVFSSLSANRIDGISFNACVVEGAAQTYTYCEGVYYYNSDIGGGIAWAVNDAASNLPVNYSGGNLQFKNSHISGDTALTKDGGTISAYFRSDDTHFELVTLNGNCEVRVHGGAIETLTLNNSNNTFLERQAFAPFNPGVSGDWTSTPRFVHSALDELAARVVEATFTATFTQSVGAKTVIVRKDKKVVTIEIPSGSTADGGAGSIASGATDLPAAYRPAADLSFPVIVTDNNVKVAGRLVVGSAGALTFTVGAAGGNFTDNVAAGFDRIAVTYSLA